MDFHLDFAKACDCVAGRPSRFILTPDHFGFCVLSRFIRCLSYLLWPKIGDCYISSELSGNNLSSSFHCSCYAFVLSYTLGSVI